MITQALERYRSHDTFAAIEFFAQQVDVLAAAKAFNEVMRHLYWKENDVAGSIAMGRAGVQFSLDAARRAETVDAELAKKLKGEAMALAYNVASFTWDGWGDVDHPVTGSDLKIGLDAAKANLRLATELNRGDLSLARAHWIVAGHSLSAGDRVGAARHYQQSVDLAAKANAKGDELSARGFAVIATMLDAPQDVALKQKLSAIKQQLDPVENGKMYAEQIDVALKFFLAKSV